MKTALALQHRPSSTQLLARVLASPDLAAQVQALPAPALGRLVERIGLEDAGELVALATPTQLADVLDEDLWKSARPGDDERFDVDRFLVWLAVLREGGDELVASRLAELPEELVTLAFHRAVMVVSLDTLMEELGEGQDAELAEKALADRLSEEIDVYQVIARTSDGWDDVLGALLALDRDHHDLAMRVLARCEAMTARRIDDEGGLYAVLQEEETLEEDVRGEREDRRGEAGHVAPSAAAAFLALARKGDGAALGEHDPLTKAWLRGLARTPLPAAPARASGARSDLAALLREAEGDDARPVALLGPAGGAEPPLLARAMARLLEDGDEAAGARSEELAYLANVLAAGAPLRGRRMRQVDAVRGAIALVSLGLELAPPAKKASDPLERAVAALRATPADGLFRLALHTLERDVRARAQAASKRARELAADDRAALRALAEPIPTLEGDLRPKGAAEDVRFFASAADVARATALLARLGV